MGLNCHGHLNEWFAFMFLDGSFYRIVVLGFSSGRYDEI
ncbi:MAG: hypothetical protein CM1200mP40_26100 [Gammaproteobacteria bacterium]|nr:MAG: hypothetical protein CM1200mP40_26100 [Gammaproteobacteria bacterium]